MDIQTREERRLQKRLFRMGAHIDQVRREVERLPEPVRRHNAGPLMRALNHLAEAIEALGDVELPNR